MLKPATEFDVLIIGASYGGAHTAVGLRQAGFTGSIGLIGDEAWAPYERPPLSKAFFMGKLEADRLWLRHEDFWAAQNISLLTGLRVETVDPEARCVRLGDGRRVGYRKLVWAAGARARRLTGGQPVHALRTLDDVSGIQSALIRAAMQPAQLAIIGAGYIGLELAAAARTLGHDVVVAEALPRVLARVTSAPVSQFYQDLHQRHGVRLELGQPGTHISADGLCLPDGRLAPAQVVVAGIGVVANIEPLRDAGIACDEAAGGIRIDASCQTSHEDILALGDCAAHPNPYAPAGRLVRLESVPNAIEQAKVVVHNLMGAPKPYDALPWFWSDQYDIKLQAAGLAMAYDDLCERRSDDGASLSVGYWRGDQLIAIDTLNRVADFMAAKILISQRAKVDRAAFADPAVSLKSLITAVPA